MYVPVLYVQSRSWRDAVAETPAGWRAASIVVSFHATARFQRNDPSDQTCPKRTYRISAPASPPAYPSTDAIQPPITGFSRKVWGSGVWDLLNSLRAC